MQSHLNQWRHNRDFLATISPQYPDWMVTSAFYVALHAVDAMLVHDRVPGVNCHDNRNAALKRTNTFKQVWRHYQPLYDMARVVRYLADPDRWLPAEEVEAQVLKRYLYPLENAVGKRIGQELYRPIALARG